MSTPAAARPGTAPESMTEDQLKQYVADLHPFDPFDPADVPEEART